MYPLSKKLNNGVTEPLFVKMVVENNDEMAFKVKTLFTVKSLIDLAKKKFKPHTNNKSRLIKVFYDKLSIHNF